MPQPGKPAPRGEDWFVRELQNLRRELQELKAANPFGLTGIDPQDGGTEFDGYVNVNGAMNVGGPLNVTGTANFTGDTNIGGNTTIDGNITKSNSWGSGSLGAAAVVGVPGGASPALTFTRSGATFAQSVGIGLQDASGITKLIINGPHASNPPYLNLNSNGTFGISADDGTGPTIQCSQGSNGNLNLYAGQANGSVNISAYGTGKCQVYGNFAVTGTKAFIMDHPVHPETMDLMHAATESPVNGVEYWGTATTGSSGTATVTLPSYFEALTKAANRNVQLTPTAACASVPWASAITSGKFTITAPPGVKFHWLVKAERQQIVDGYDTLSFPAEQDKPLIGPQLPTSGLG